MQAGARPAPGQPGSGTGSFEIDYRLTELDGGTRVITAPMPGRLSAAVVLMFGVGSRHEAPRVGGVSHFVEHMMFKGTRRRPNTKLISEAVEGVGGVLNAYTDKEVTAYWTRVPADRVELGIDVLTDMVGGSLLDPAEVDRERGVILEELKMHNDQPSDFAFSMFERAIWPGHELGREIIGTETALKAMSREDLVEHIREHYRTHNLVVSVSGGIEADEVLSALDRRLELPRRRRRVDPRPAPPELSKPGLAVHRRKTEQAHVYLGFRALSYLDPDRYVLDVLNTILGEGMSSRLFLEIRERRGLAYDVHSFTSRHVDAGYLAVYLGVDPGKAPLAVATVMQELRALTERPVPAEELSKTKEYLKGRLKLGLEGTNSLASWLAQQELLMGRIRAVSEVVTEIDRVTAEDVRRVARRVLGSVPQLTVVGPYASDAKFRGVLD